MELGASFVGAAAGAFAQAVNQAGRAAAVRVRRKRRLQKGQGGNDRGREPRQHQHPGLNAAAGFIIKTLRAFYTDYYQTYTQYIILLCFDL